jgi:hypothetical protein
MSEIKGNNVNPNDNAEMTMEEARKIIGMTVEEIEEMGDEAGNPGYPNPGKYGLLALEYLKEQRPGRYQYHMMEGDLTDVLLRLEREAADMMETLQTQLRQRNPRPKTDSYLTLLQYETMIRDAAEETVLAEIVYRVR